MEWPPVQCIGKKLISVGCLSYPVEMVHGILSVNSFFLGGGGSVNMDNGNGVNCGDNI